MAQTRGGVHLVRVITDDLEYQIWVAATSASDAPRRFYRATRRRSASCIDWRRDIAAIEALLAFRMQSCDKQPMLLLPDARNWPFAAVEVGR